jgi:beta-glucosidase
VTPLAGLREALGQDRVAYARGCEVFGEDRAGFAEAVTAADGTDVAVVVVAGKSGLARPASSGEANDATDLSLPGVQEALVDAVARTGTPVVVVVLSGRVHTLDRIAGLAGALVMLVPPGEEGGHGLADVLTGRVNAGGRLPVSLPRSVGQIPLFAETRSGGDRAMFFKDYIDGPVSPLFPFGHGLSYTHFSYSDLQADFRATSDPVQISVRVSNDGPVAGDEVVQLYVRDEMASVARPVMQLVGFTRVTLDTGESETVSFAVHPSRLAFHNPEMELVVEPGDFTFKVGPSSADIRVEQTVTLTGPTAQFLQREVVATEARVGSG